MFAESQLAGQRAAIVMSLVQSVRLNGQEPWVHLRDVTSPPNFGLFKTGVKVAFSAGPPGPEGEAMKGPRFSEEQIAYALRLAESGTPVVVRARPLPT